jgi:hypothetical protein
LPYRQRKPEKEQFRIECPNHKEKIMSQYMWSGELGAGVCCQACKYATETKDGGKTWEERKK